jgi:hypothetical protein
MNDVSTITLRMFLEHPLDIPLLQWALFVIVLTFVGTCAYLQFKNDSLDLRWLIMERPHKPSLPKIGQVVALIVSTWGFVTLVMKGQLTETYFMCYMTVWSGSAALETYFNKGTRSNERSTDPAPGSTDGKDGQ